MGTDTEKRDRHQLWLILRTCFVGVTVIAGVAIVALWFDLLPEQFPTPRIAVAALLLVAALPVFCFTAVRIGRYLPGWLIRHLCPLAAAFGFLALVLYAMKATYQ